MSDIIESTLSIFLFLSLRQIEENSPHRENQVSGVEEKLTKGLTLRNDGDERRIV